MQKQTQQNKKAHTKNKCTCMQEICKTYTYRNTPKQLKYIKTPICNVQKKEVKEEKKQIRRFTKG